jgi:transcriptional regulator with XRE-family HTH domain
VATIETYFGQQVRQLRDALEISQEELAFRADLSAQYVSRIERGVQSPSLLVIQKIAKALGMPISELMHHVEKSMPGDTRRAKRRS